MSGIRAALIAALADGAVHSGTDLAQRLACSRTAIWKHLNELKAVGLQIDARPGIGYQLAQRLELLDRDVILRGLSMQSSAALGCLELHDVIESTSERLRGLPSPSPGRFDAVLAEYQLGGRGRRGRQWLSPFGSGLCLSVNRCFENTPDALSALSLAVGVGVCRVLRDDMTTQIGLKWPNDIVAGNSKLGGLLIDVQGEADGPIAVIVGIGLNFDVSGSMTEQVASTGGLPPIGLRELVREVDPSGPDVSRNDLAARLINAMYTVLTEFEQHGFAPFVDEWRRYDWLANRSVVAQIGQRSISGTARGIAKDGALLIDANGELQRLVSGEVSLRPGCEGKL
jgi:BirA family biotin operon repressor/biotin-[acetyl-CoA-carboxylase] ligase